MRRVTPVLLLLLLFGCGQIQFENQSDSGTQDANILDAPDAGLLDANVEDARPLDTPPPLDGSPPVDAPAVDANPIDELLVGCVARYEMEESTWTADAVRDSCGANDGAAGGGASPVMDPMRGRVGEFVGGTSCVIVPDSLELRGGSMLTMAAWVRADELAPDAFGLVAKRSSFGVGDAEYTMFLWASDAGTGLDNHLYTDIDTEDQRFELSGEVFLGTWRHAAVVYDGTRASAQRITVYVDGAFQQFAEEASSTITPQATPRPLHLGCLPLGSPAQALVGRLDDVVIWQRALSADEIRLWYETTR